MPIEIMKRYTREYIQANPDKYFVFGDNLAREGFGCQAAAARGEPNSIGIATKMSPTYEEIDFFSDEHYQFNINQIMEDFKDVFSMLDSHHAVVWPEDGIGTGLADLPTRAPETLKFINCIIESLKTIYGVIPCT